MDVVEYIESLAAERNKFKVEAERLENELRLAEERADELEKNAAVREASRELEDERLRLCGEMKNIIESTRSGYADVKSGVEESAAGIRDEFMRLCDSCERLIELLNQSGERLSSLDINLQDCE